MLTLLSLTARQILDSRGNPTVECDAVLSDGSMGRAAVPSGASTGMHEAVERRDGSSRFEGKSVFGAVGAIAETIFPLVKDIDPFDQARLDRAMIQADGSPNKSVFGANAILAVSLAIAKACAQSSGVPLHQYVATIAGTEHQKMLPMPMINVMNGGQHAAFATDIQEYMIVPVGAESMEDALEVGTTIFHALKHLLHADGFATTVGDEGGFAPRLPGGNEAPLESIMQAIESSGFKPGKTVAIALDVAASEFYADGVYELKTEQRQLDADGMIDYLEALSSDFPIVSIEDGLEQNDWDNWRRLTERLGASSLLVGDDFLVTNTERLRRAIELRAGNAILIKPNQIGTLSETIDAVKLAKQQGWRTIMSHRSGETEDTTIAHLAVGLGCDGIKAGSLSRTDRVAKYNELLRIAEREPSLRFQKWWRVV